jgi:hypothetical protein
MPEALQGAAMAVLPGIGLGILAELWMWRRSRKAADTSSIVAVRPTQKKFVPAVVLGDVPYSDRFFDRLIVGDGRPVATAAGNRRVVAPRTLPETLTVQGVRPFRPGDPRHWSKAYKYHGVVIECQDGDRPVLIVTRRRDAPPDPRCAGHENRLGRRRGHGTRGRYVAPVGPLPACAPYPLLSLPSHHLPGSRQRGGSGSSRNTRVRSTLTDGHPIDGSLPHLHLSGVGR